MEEEVYLEEVEKKKPIKTSLMGYLDKIKLDNTNQNTTLTDKGFAASVIIALIIYAMDQSFNSMLGWFYSMFKF